MTTRSRAWQSALALAATTAVISESGQAQQFRSGVTLQVLDVVVTDAGDRPVLGLRPDDFEVMVDGVAATVKFATAVAVPATSTPAHSSASPVNNNSVWTNDSVANRVFAIVLDDLNTRASDTAKARTIVQRFIDRLPDGDLAAVVFTGQQTGAQEFTADKERLALSLRQYTGRYDRPEFDLVSDPTALDLAMRSTLGGEVAANHSRTLQTLVNVTEWLATIRDRRKAILFVTAGLEAGLAQAFLGGLDNETPSSATLGGAFARLVDLADAANVAIYPLDYQGLSAPLSRSAQEAGANGPNPLMIMAAETGGLASVNNNNPDRLFSRIIQDSSAYYLVGYEFNEPNQDRQREEKRRRIVVRMRREGLDARTRRTVVSRSSSDADGPQLSASTLLSSPLPGGSLALRAQVSPFSKQNGKARAVVVIDVDGSKLQRDASASDGRVNVEYRIVATDVRGRAEASESRELSLRLSPERLQHVSEHQLRILSHLDLPPGSFRVRASVVGGGGHGVVAGDIDVPDYKRSTFVVSEPLVVSSDTAAIPVRREDYEPFKARLSAAPTAQRRFGINELVEIYVEVYMRMTGGSATSPKARAVILNHAGAEEAIVPIQVGSPGKGVAGGTVFPVVARLSFDGLTTGHHQLDVVVEAEGQRPIARHLRFELQ